MSPEKEPRPGEVSLGFDPADRIEAGLTFIGRIRSGWTKAADNAPRNLRAARARADAPAPYIELDAAYLPGLQGLAVGQAIQILYWVDRGVRDLIVQNPRHTEGTRGVFALRSPVRPNPIALGTVVITSMDLEAGIIGIDTTDAYDGTPLLDIKPWIERVDVPPGWQPGG